MISCLHTSMSNVQYVGQKGGIWLNTYLYAYVVVHMGVPRIFYLCPM